MAGLIGGSSAKKLRVQEFRSSGMFNRPSGVETVELLLVGGGGAGGASTGGNPGRLLRIKYDVSGKTSCAVVIGAGGASGANGGDSSFDGVVIAQGGNGQVLSTVAAMPSMGEDGFGGISSNSSNFPSMNGGLFNANAVANSGAGGPPNFNGGSGYCRVEWYE